MLAGRLGLETSRVPHADRHGVVWLQFGRLYVEDGTLRFLAATSKLMDAGDYALPFQTISCILLGPGSSVSHDALRILARHGTGLVAIAEDGTRLYASMPFGPGDSELARRQIELWHAADTRLLVARRMYALRFHEVLPSEDIEVLRGIEGGRVKAMYKLMAQKHRIPWKGRRYDRSDPEATDLPNQAINHAASAVEGAALTATAITGALPQLGFVHADSSNAFALDIADIYRTEITVESAFAAARVALANPNSTNIERETRQHVGRMLTQKAVVADMIDKIKTVLAPP